MAIAQIAEQTAVILAALTGIAGLIYWAIHSKLKDDFCNKVDCEKKHTALDLNMLSYRKDISDDIREIKEIVVRIETRFFEWISKQGHKQND